MKNFIEENKEVVFFMGSAGEVGEQVIAIPVSALKGMELFDPLTHVAVPIKPSEEMISSFINGQSKFVYPKFDEAVITAHDFDLQNLRNEFTLGYKAMIAHTEGGEGAPKSDNHLGAWNPST